MNIVDSSNCVSTIAHSVLRSKYCTYFREKDNEIGDDSITGEGTNDVAESLKN